MTKFLDKFLEFKNEAEGTKRFALVALAIITVSLAMLSISGAWAASEAKGDIIAQILTFIPRLFYAFLVLGLELFAAVLFVRALVASHWMQSAICGLMLLFLAWANVQNAKDGVHFIMPTRFEATGETLRAKAKLAGDRASDEGVARKAVSTSIPDELARVRREMAKLEDEANLMTSQTRIREAQERLVFLQLYPRDRVDGVRADITLTAMAQRGEAITKELALLKNEERQLKGETGLPTVSAPGAAPVVAADQRDVQIDLDAKAREAESAALRLEIILWVAEIARSLGLWAAVTSVSRAGTSRLRKLEEEIEAAKLEAALAAIRAPSMAPAPVSVAPAPPPPEPPPAAIPEPVEAVAPPPPPPIAPDAQHMRNMALASAQARAGRKAQAEQFIPVPSLVARDASLKVAAE